MIRNYIRVALRNLARNRTYAVMNVVGLAIGMAACILIFFLVRFELSFDNFYPEKDRIYRVVEVQHNSDGTFFSPGVPFPVPNGLRSEFPQIGEVAAISHERNSLITVLDQDGRNASAKFKEESAVFFVEPQFFDIFRFKWMIGAPMTALSEPNTVVLTRAIADKYFGDWKNATGKLIKFENKDILKVTGIIQDMPKNSDFPLGVMISYKTFENDKPENFKDWVSVYGSNYCFLLLKNGTTETGAESFLSTIVKEHKPPEYQKDQMELQPLSEMHFDSRFGNYSNRTFSHQLISALILIAGFLLVIACVNFINLSTAQAANRAREVGVRKVLGGNRRQLAVQFLSETAIITFLSLLLGIGISETAIPFLDRLLNVPLDLSFSFDPGLLGCLVVLFAAVVVLSGFYPAFVLSGFDPVAAIKSKMTVHTVGGVSLRKGLVVFQFIIAQVMIFGMLVVVSQMNYFKSVPLGLNKDAIVTVPIPDDSLSQMKIFALKNRLLAQPGVRTVSFSTFSAIDDAHWSSDFKFNNSSKTSDFEADLLWADPDYFKTYDIEFVAGGPYLPADTTRGFVVNQTLLKRLGIRDPQEALGKKIDFWNGHIVAPIVGVVRDFNDHPLFKPIYPAIMGSWREVYELINIKIVPNHPEESLAGIERIWKDTYPNYVYEYQFLDAKIDSFYKGEDRLSTLYTLFAGVAIFISALGLYGLVSFMAERRTKEVGIRKVLGASVRQILYLFSREFATLIFVAFLTAAPIGYYITNLWLDHFAYRIHLDVGLFILTITSTLVIAGMTIGFKTWRVVAANPVESLRYE